MHQIVSKAMRFAPLLTTRMQESSNALRAILPAIFSALVACCTTALILAKGIPLGPDGWAYLEGSVSLKAGLGYTYFGGQSIEAFPPLTSAVLSVLQVPLGSTGYSLFVILVLLAALNAFTWTYLITTLSERSQLSSSAIAALTIALYTSLCYRTLLAEHLSLPLAATTLVVLASLRDAAPRSSTTRIAFLIFFCALLLLTKNSNVAIVFAVSTLTFFVTSGNRISRLIVALSVAGCPVLIWIIVRTLLGQSGSHSVSLNAGKYSTIQYLAQVFVGYLKELGPLAPYAAVGFFAYVVALTRPPQALSNASAYDRRYSTLGRLESIARTMFLPLSALIYTLALIALFNVVYINDTPSGRFLWVPSFCVLTYYLAAGATTATRSHRALMTVLYLLFSYKALYWLYAFARCFETLGLPALHSDTAQLVHMNTMVDPLHFSQPVEYIGRTSLISPPDFPWIDRAYEQPIP